MPYNQTLLNISIMSAIRSEENHNPKDMKGVHSHEGEISDLIFSFDNDIETDYATLNITPQQPYNGIISRSPSLSSSASLGGYVILSSPDQEGKGGHTFTDTYTPETSPTSNRRTSKDGRRRTTPLSLMVPSIFPLQPSDNTEYLKTKNSFSSQHNSHQESAYSPAPESTTPHTRQFKESMLSLLTLLPPERYSSPSPSIIEDQFDEMDYEEDGSDTCATSRAIPIHATSVDYSSRNHLLLSSPGSLSSFIADQGQIERDVEGTGLGKT